MAAPALFAQRTRADFAGTGVAVCGNLGTAGGFHFDFKIIAFLKYFHAQKVHAFSTGVEIKGAFAGIIHGILGGVKALKNPALIFFGDSHPEIAHPQCSSILMGLNDNFDAAFIGRILNSIFDQTVEDFAQ